MADKEEHKPEHKAEHRPEHKPEPKPVAPSVPPKDDFRYLVRIANTDLDGNRMIVDAIRKIRGISFMFANAICIAAVIDKKSKTGLMKDSEIAKIDEVIRNPAKFKIPAWMYNRRRDVDTGADMHLIMSDLKFYHENDIKMMKKVRSYKGVRHSQNAPVRGQKTRSNFRQNKGKVLGVKRGKAKSGKV
jgi:small subunit ribosomal protein S13